MTANLLSEIIGRAIVDNGFRQDLLQDPVTTLADVPLTLEEQQVLNRCQAETLEEFASKIHAWLEANNGQIKSILH